MELWLRFFFYDIVKVVKFVEFVQSGVFELYLIFGEVEVDWDYDVEIRYCCLDEEILQVFIVIEMFGFVFQFIYCVGDIVGGGDGWRIGEVVIYDKFNFFVKFEGVFFIVEVEK